MRPGTYTVTFTLPGFNTFKREAIELPANFTAPVNAELQVGGLERRLPSPDIGSYAQFLSDPRRVRFHSCTRIPFWWIPGNRNMSGLTLANRVYLRVEHCPIDPSNRATVELVLHELATCCISAGIRFSSASGTCCITCDTDMRRILRKSRRGGWPHSSRNNIFVIPTTETSWFLDPTCLVGIKWRQHFARQLSFGKAELRRGIFALRRRGVGL